MSERPHVVVIVNTVLIVLTFFSLLVRLITRTRAGQAGADDIWLVCATVAAIIISICCAVATNYGLGQHAKHQLSSQVETYQKLLLVANFFYYAGNTLVKISILVFYQRLEKRKTCLYLIYAMMFVIAGFGVGRCVAAVCQCIPLNKVWNQSVPGTCFNVVTSYYVNSGIMFTTDIIVYLMPVEFVLKMDMPARQKLAMLGLFGLGGFVCIASAIRLVMVHQQVVYGDATYNVALVLVWSCVEVHTAIIATCAPFFRALFRRYSPLVTHSSASSSRKSGGADQHPAVRAHVYSSKDGSSNLSERGLGATFADYFSFNKSKLTSSHAAARSSSDDEGLGEDRISGSTRSGDSGAGLIGNEKTPYHDNSSSTVTTLSSLNREKQAMIASNV